MHKRAISHIVLAITASLATLSPAIAQTFPDKPVKVILPYPAGVGPDAVMRLVGEKVSKSWGQPIVIENRPGGNAFIAMSAVKKAPADGYTLVQVDAAIMALTPQLYKQIPYDPVKDFVPVAPMYWTHYLVTVAADSPWKTIGDLAAAAKAKDGALSYGSSGVGSHMHLGGAMLEAGTGAKMSHVPYKETGQVFTDVSRGELGWAFGSPASTAALFQAKKVKYLAIGAPRRDPNLPDVPTVAEAGGPPNFELRTWIGLYAPAGTPAAVVTRINAEIAKALAEPDVRERLRTLGATAWPGPASELARAQKVDYDQFTEVVRRVNISLD